MILKPDDSSVVFFTHAELCDPDTGTVQLATGFGKCLAYLRLLWGERMIVTSCCRSAAQNAKHGGHPRSLHIWDKPAHEGLDGTAAIDLHCGGPPAVRAMLVRLALEQGWSVGVSQTTLHLDRRDLTGRQQGLFLL